MDRTLQGHGQHRVQETERRQANQKHNTENYKVEQLGQKQKHRELVTHTNPSVFFTQNTRIEQTLWEITEKKYSKKNSYT
jgi:hypothetical protein